MALSLQISLLSLLLSLIALKLYQRLRYKFPPGPRPWPVVGNLYDIKPIRFRCFAEWADKYGPIVSVWFGSTLNVVVSSSDLAKEVLREKDQQLADRPRDGTATKFSRNGQDLIWADYGPHYVKVRKVCNLELFTAKRLESLRHIREDEVTAMVEAIFTDFIQSGKAGKSMLIREYLSPVAFNNIARLSLGKRVMDQAEHVDEQGAEIKRLVTEGIKVGGSLPIFEYVPWLRWFFPDQLKAIEIRADRRNRVSKAIIEEHTQKFSATQKQHHFMEALISLKDQYDLSEDTIIGLLWDMITAGMDTTVIASEWGMAELIKNPRVLRKAQEELDRVVGKDRVVTEPDFANLPYLHSVVKESLRLHPSTPLMLPHKASSDVKIGGYDIPKGSIVHINVWAIARDPKVWKNPLEFRPERFAEDDVDMKGHDFRLLPFGAGRRVCPGAQLGINLVQSMLAHLLHHFDWTVPEGVKPEEIDMSETPGLVSFMKSPLRVVAKPRLPPELYKRMC